MLLAVIAATAVVVGGLTMEILSRGSCQGGRLHWRTLADAEKWPEQVTVMAAEIDWKNTVAGGECGGTGGYGGYGQIASRKMVMVVPIRWPKEDWGLAGGEPKCLRL